MASVLQAPPRLWDGIKGLVVFGWAVAGVRYLLEWAAHAGWVAPQHTMLVGVYFAMPAALTYVGFMGRLDRWPWRKLALGMLAIGGLCWTLPNVVSYATAQAMEWNHGRFFYDAADAHRTRSAPIGEGAVTKVLLALVTALGTGLAGSGWSLAWASGVVWFPGWWRRRSAARSGRAVTGREGA